MKSVVTKHKLLLVLFCSLLLLVGYWLFIPGKINLHLLVNNWVGNAVADVFFFYITYLGDGRIAVIILLLSLIYNLRLGLATTISFLASGALANLLKYTLFDEYNRPSFYFTYYQHLQLKLVEGIDVHIHNSFPSGHATQAFAIFMVYALFSKKQAYAFFWLTLAVLTAFSRMYLNQHWLSDIYAGAIIGSAFALLSYYLVYANDKLLRFNKGLITYIQQRA